MKNTDATPSDPALPQPESAEGATQVVHGWLEDALRVPSPNYDDRPPGTEVSLLVVHNISLPPGEFGGNWIDDLFLNRLDPTLHPYFRELMGLRVSAHLLIRRDGALIQYVPLEKRAWHAGRSQFQGCRNCNDFSIGIEIEGSDEVAFEPAQYQCLAQVTRRILSSFPRIAAERIVGHCDVAPGRKTDPGPHFDWSHYRRLLSPDVS